VYDIDHNIGVNIETNSNCEQNGMSEHIILSLYVYYKAKQLFFYLVRMFFCWMLF